ncbi:rhoptry neck protein RON9 [Cryptosporidium felis]|nr:rhoptry neck protein RON9 [Cryptosporidium felis]
MFKFLFSSYIAILIIFTRSISAKRTIKYDSGNIIRSDKEVQKSKLNLLFNGKDVGDSMRFNCKMLFESIYYDKSARSFVKLLLNKNVLDKFQELSSESDYILKYIKNDIYNLNGEYKPTIDSNIVFEGKNVVKSKIDLNECRVNKETGISLFNIGETLLHSAVISGRLNVVILLLLSGINVNIKLQKYEKSDFPILGFVGGYIGDLEGMTALHYTSLIQDLESIEVAKLLLRFGANPNEKDNYKRTPLHTVGLTRNLHPKKMASILLDAGAIINKRDISKFTPLHIAASRNNLPIVNLLVSNGIGSVNERSIEYSVDYNGNTPLHIAAIHNSGDVIPLLIRDREDVFKQNYNGLTPFELSAFPFGYRALNPLEVPAMAFSVIQARMDFDNFQEYRDKLEHSYFYAIKEGYLQILQKIIFTRGQGIGNTNHHIFDINKGIIIAEKKGNKNISNYLKSFGVTIVCPNPPNILNSNYKLSDTAIGNHIRVGDTVTYECYEDFVLIGFPTITCNLSDDKAFYIPTPPSCVEPPKDLEIATKGKNQKLKTFVFIVMMIIILLILMVVIMNSRSKIQKMNVHDNSNRISP